MLIDVEFEATPQLIRLKSSTADYELELPNSLLFDENSNKLYGIGRTEEILKREAPDVWAKRPSSLCFRPIYDSENFAPFMTYAALRFLSEVVYCHIRPMLVRMFLRRFDKFAYRLVLPDYYSVNQTLRHQFEHEIFFCNFVGTGKIQVRELVINGLLIQHSKAA